jgi:L-rhamnose mutarotase
VFYSTQNFQEKELVRKLKLQLIFISSLIMAFLNCNPKMEIQIQRYGSSIGVKKEFEERYIILHKHTFSGVLERIHKSNIRNYSIFLHDGILFSHFEYIGSDFKADMEAIADETTKEWWKLTDPMQEPLQNRKEGEWWSSMDLLYQMNRSKIPYPEAQRKAFVGTLKVNKRASFANRLKKIDESLIQVLLETNFQNITFYAVGHQAYFYSEYAGKDYEAEARELFSKKSFRKLDSDLRSLLEPDSLQRTWIPMEEVFHTD